MSENLLKEIEELKSEIEKLTRRNKILQKKLTRIRKKGEDPEDTEEDLKEYTKLERKLPEHNVDRCKKCGAPTEEIVLNMGTLYVCSICKHREFIK